MEAPKRGDLITLDFDNTQGHEQAGYRRAIVISPLAYNRKTGLATVCAITNQKKGYPFEVDIPKGLKVTGVVLSDQVRTIDWEARQFRIEDEAPAECTQKVMDLLAKLTQ
jgi:mRNA interferase MazF